MKKSIFLSLVVLGLLAAVAVNAWHPVAHAQQGPLPSTPVDFHRFIVSNNSLGIFLTTNLSEGQGYPYNYAYFPFPSPGAKIVLTPASGYSPRAGQGLLALHRYQVVQSGRVYYYYTIYPGGQGSSYHYQGHVGWVLPNSGAFGGQPLHFWYSQQYGYYYTLDGEYPPCCSFSYHGVQYYLPTGSTAYIFDPPPPDPCAGYEWERDQCWMNGGIWDNNSCYCDYGGGGCGPYGQYCYGSEEAPPAEQP
ncbi:MAG TPA: hypothetical protein VGV38_14710 [Pyrinomonadaceae bacterium]|nr:hypothetical protein [Pyrinomonadaceae bacterium]